MVIETILRPFVDLQTASARCNSKQTILRPLVDSQTASKRSNGYSDHFKAVCGFANGVSEMQ